MIADQDTLRRHFAEMLVSRGYRLEDLVGEDGKWTIAEPADAVHALVVVERFDLREYVLGTLAFLAKLDRTTLEPWHRNFTKTLFMLGAPSRVAGRFDILSHRADDDSIAWAIPGNSKAHLGLRRLLKPLVTSRLPALPERVAFTVPSGTGHAQARRLELRLVRTGTLESTLVHLNHVLCEAFVTQAIRPGDSLTLVHVDDLSELPDSSLYLRVHLDGDDPTKLKAYGCLVATDHDDREGG